MSNIQISISQTAIKEMRYSNLITAVTAKPVRLEVKTHAKVKLNMSTPLSAIFEVTFQAVEPEEERIYLEIQTYTPVTVSSYIDNLDKVLQKEYMSSIMLAVNEKIRMVTSVLGLNMRVPNLTFSYENKHHD